MTQQRLTTLFLLLFFAFAAPASYGQMFYAKTHVSTHKEKFQEFKMNLEGLPDKLDTALFGLEKLCVNSTVSVEEKLEMRLVSPDGQQVLLFAMKGGTDLEEVPGFCMSDEGQRKLSYSTKAGDVNFFSQENLGELNNGQNPNGIWTLQVRGDYVNESLGEEIEWRLYFGPKPSKPFGFTSSNLPIVTINTYGNVIPDEPKIVCKMSIIDNGPGVRNRLTDTVFQYIGYTGIELRGSSSMKFPQKSFGLTTLDETASNPKDASLLGMPKESDWILYAPYRDKSMLRNPLTYDIARQMGSYAPRTAFCEVVLNGRYQGVYVLTEKVKRDKHRVNISRMDGDDNAGDSLTGGYLFKIDRYNGNDMKGWTSPVQPYAYDQGQEVTYVYDYPKGDFITEQQMAYIKAYVDSFEGAFNRSIGKMEKHYYEYIDLPSFVDFFIITELSKNFDGYRASAFIQKDRDSKGGRLKMGPVWDFDFAWHNSKTCDANTVEGWAIDFGNYCFGDGMQVPAYWDCMRSDSTFTHALYKRWQLLRKDILSEQRLCAYVDSNVAYLKEAGDRHYLMWPQRDNVPSDQVYRNRADEIADLKKWIVDRLRWMDANMPR